MLKFKVDENMPVEVAAVLADAGHDAVTVPDQQLGGQPDFNVAAVCKQEDRAIKLFSSTARYVRSDRLCALV